MIAEIAPSSYQEIFRRELRLFKKETVAPLLQKHRLNFSLEPIGFAGIEPLSTKEMTLFVPYLFLIQNSLPPDLQLKQLSDPRLYEEEYLKKVADWTRKEFGLSDLSRSLTEQERRGIRWFAAFSIDPKERESILRFLVEREIAHVSYRHTPFYGGVSELISSAFLSKTLFSYTVFCGGMTSLALAFFQLPLPWTAVAMGVFYVAFGILRIFVSRSHSLHMERAADRFAVRSDPLMRDVAVSYFEKAQYLMQKEREEGFFNRLWISSTGNHLASWFIAPSWDERIASFPPVVGKPSVRSSSPLDDPSEEAPLPRGPLHYASQEELDGMRRQLEIDLYWKKKEQPKLSQNNA